MLEIGPGPDGKPVYQMVTVHLKGGFTPWRADFARAWGPGDYGVPELFYRPEVERANEHELAIKGGAAGVQTATMEQEPALEDVLQQSTTPDVQTP
jgi:hypothetical protein